MHNPGPGQLGQSMYIEHNLQKALCDRIYEKRKPAALQLEQIVRKALEAQNTQFVDGIITELSRDFAYALRHPNYRNGGLIGLAAVAIALGQDLLPNYLDDIIQPILTCFGDADSRVRYYACESLYNVAKIAKDDILVYFNEIFDALCKLTADVEESVRTGANLVDQLMRDIVVETTSNDVFYVDKDKPVVPSPVEQPLGPEGPTLQTSVVETEVPPGRDSPLVEEPETPTNEAIEAHKTEARAAIEANPSSAGAGASDAGAAGTGAAGTGAASTGAAGAGAAGTGAAGTGVAGATSADADVPDSTAGTSGAATTDFSGSNPSNPAATDASADGGQPGVDSAAASAAASKSATPGVGEATDDAPQTRESTIETETPVYSTTAPQVASGNASTASISNGNINNFGNNDAKLHSLNKPFTLQRFIPLLVERIYVLNPATRMFLVQWIMLLDSIPDLELVKYVPEFLEGLLTFLSDTHKEVRIFTKTCLDTLLNTIKSTANLHHEISTQKISPNESSGIEASLYRIGQDTYISYPEIVNTLLSKMDPSHDGTRLVALDWIDGILSVSPNDVIAKLGALIVLLIPALSDEVPEIRDAGKHLNEKLLQVIGDYSATIDSASALRALGIQLESEDKTTRLASLRWLSTLYRSKDMTSFREDILTKLLLPLNDPSDEVVASGLKLIALIYEDAPPAEFKILGKTLLNAFKADRLLFTNRGKLVLLQLCILLSPVRIFEVISGLCDEALRKSSIPEQKETSDGKSTAGFMPTSPAAPGHVGSVTPLQGNDSEFYLLVIQNLNNILLTATDLQDFRAQLTQLHTVDGARLFSTLFNCCVWNSVAVLALCLLAGAYEPASAVLETLARHDISVSTLVQIDRLIQYLEGPNFAALRLDLLEPHRYPYLYKTLYGLLMVLPQSPSFHTLQTRLHSISPIVNLPQAESSLAKKRADPNSKEEKPLVDWNRLLNTFRRAHGK